MIVNDITINNKLNEHNDSFVVIKGNYTGFRMKKKTVKPIPQSPPPTPPPKKTFFHQDTWCYSITSEQTVKIGSIGLTQNVGTLHNILIYNQSNQITKIRE